VIRAVLDTNALLSGIVGVEKETSTPGAIVRAWRAKQFELVTSEHIRTELQRHLTDDSYFASRLSADEVVANLESLAVDAIQATIAVDVAGVATHPEDDLVLAAAVSAGADFLVSGDRHLQALGRYEGVTILSPRAFLDALEVASRSEEDSVLREESHTEEEPETEDRDATTER
jgi:uncharacterized protein